MAQLAPGTMASVIRLWDDAAAGAAEIGPVPFAPGVDIVRNVTVPVLVPVQAEGSTAVIVAPGGAYRFLAIEHEGFAVAKALAGPDVATYVLKYRVVPTPPDDDGFRDAMQATFRTPGRDWRDEIGPLLVDGPQAVRCARARGHDRVVMVGFSAGGLLTIETLRSDAPPDAAALIYPGVPLDLDAAPADAPPLFVLMANDDPLGAHHAARVHDLWRAAGRSSELHLFDRGGHGFGTNPTGLPVDRWLDLVGAWLDALP